MALIWRHAHAQKMCFILYTDENAPESCTMDITALFKEYTVTSVAEATPDFLEIPHSQCQDEQKGGQGCGMENNGKYLISLDPLKLKTLIITLEKDNA